MEFSESHFQIVFSVLNTNDFCLLILYPAILLNPYYSNRNFGSLSMIMESLGFSLYKSMLYAKSNNFLSLFCLIALARTSTTVFNRSANSEHPCAVPHLRGNFQFLAIEYDISFLYMIPIILK